MLNLYHRNLVRKPNVRTQTLCIEGETSERQKDSFRGLHAHSVAGSIFDAIGYPDEHMDFCYENGGEALALTDHGNMNGFSHQFLHWQKMKSEGKEFKPIFGVEAYFLPSIDEWRADYDRIKEDKKLAKSLGKRG